jgi:hypothetical protein
MSGRLNRNWSPEERWYYFAKGEPGTSTTIEITGELYYHPTLSGIILPTANRKGLKSKQIALLQAHAYKIYYQAKVNKLHEDLKNVKNRLQSKM